MGLSRGRENARSLGLLIPTVVARLKRAARAALFYVSECGLVWNFVVLRTLGGVVLFAVPFWEGNHFDAGEHVVANRDGGDVALVIGVNEAYAACIPVGAPVFFAGLYVEFESLLSHLVSPI